jgi:hypothetical protein
MLINGTAASFIKNDHSYLSGHFLYKKIKERRKSMDKGIVIGGLFSLILFIIAVYQVLQVLLNKQSWIDNIVKIGITEILAISCLILTLWLASRRW